MKSQESLAEVFVQIADTLVADFDIVEFLQHLCDRCVELLGVDAAGLLSADPHGRLRSMAATSQEAHRLELYQLRSGEGPCLDCHRDGQAVVIADVAAVTARWPRFAPACQSGRRSGRCVFMRVTRMLGSPTLARTVIDGTASYPGPNRGSPAQA